MEAVPIIGFGTWINSEHVTKDDYVSMKKAIKDALHIGYRHIDTAVNYNTHDIVVEAINESGLKRQDVSITTKVSSVGDLDKIQQFVDKISYIDCLLIHHPSGIGYDLKQFRNNLVTFWSSLTELVNSGKVRFLGVSNFYINALTALLSIIKDSRLTPCTFLQLEINIIDQNHKYVKYCKSKGLIVVAHTPLGGLGNRMIVHQIKDISKKYNLTPEQLQLVALMGRDIIVIPSSRHHDHIKSNFDCVNIMSNLNKDILINIIEDLKPFDLHFPLTSAVDRDYDIILTDETNIDVRQYEDSNPGFYGITPKPPQGTTQWDTEVTTITLPHPVPRPIVISIPDRSGTPHLPIVSFKSTPLPAISMLFRPTTPHIPIVSSNIVLPPVISTSSRLSTPHLPIVASKMTITDSQPISVPTSSNPGQLIIRPYIRNQHVDIPNTTTRRSYIIPNHHPTHLHQS
jgi:diketogulonate reductase-like aldo/keto reductase